MTEPTYEIRRVAFKFHDTPNSRGVANIAIGFVPLELQEDPSFDEDIFYYCANEDEFARLFNEDTEDFYLIKEDD
jgi:hypothetical protein